jgi:hypothetical protein
LLAVAVAVLRLVLVVVLAAIAVLLPEKTLAVVAAQNHHLR